MIALDTSSRAKCDWTEGELAMLRDAYRRAGGDHRRAIDLCRRHLPGRSDRSIRSRAVLLRLTRDCQTPPERVTPIQLRRLETLTPATGGRPTCPQCEARVLFRNPDGDLECVVCGTVVYTTVADGRG